MKYLFLTSIILLLLSCGEDTSTENETSTDHQEEVENDTTSLDSILVEEDYTPELTIDPDKFYFEDYAQHDTKTKLHQAFPDSMVSDQTTWILEGTEQIETSVYSDSINKIAITYYWSQENNEDLYYIECWKQGEWNDLMEAKGGVFLGMTLEELVAWNDGKPVKFAGFGWDGSGGVWGSDGNSKLDLVKTNFTLELDYSANSGYDLTGDMGLSSDEERVQGAPIYVYSMTYYPNE
jgi:hypothetical protein